MNTIKYEWTLETLEGEDIIDSDFMDKLTAPLVIEYNQRLGLVRNEGNERDGLTNRLWAYVIPGSVDRLPVFFEDANEQPTRYKVPNKYVQELIKVFKK